MTNVSIDLYVINECEMHIIKQLDYEKEEYIISIDTNSGIGYLLDEESHDVILESEDFGLSVNGTPRELREKAFYVIIEYLLLKTKLTISEDSPRKKIIQEFCKGLAEHMI